MTTHRLHKTPAVKGMHNTTTYMFSYKSKYYTSLFFSPLMLTDNNAVTTFTDYVNPYASILQTSCCNFTRTATTGELCAGIVKASGIYPKNPAQHASDIEMLEDTPEIDPAFTNPTTGKRKAIECVRVDGACDEGPSHEEAQFFWAQRHFEN